MKVKVFYPNKEGKIEFTPKELETLLDEIYEEAYQDYLRKPYTIYNPTITTTKTAPYIDTTPYYTTTTACSDDSISGCTVSSSGGLTYTNGSVSINAEDLATKCSIIGNASAVSASSLT